MNPRGTKKRCTKCRLPLPLKDFYYHRTRKLYADSCKKCNGKACQQYQTRKRNENDARFIFMMRASQIRRGAKTKPVAVMGGLGLYLLSMWEKTGGRCYYTGRKMNLDGKYHTDPNAATVDRLIPKLGYTKGNVVLATAIANRVKQNLSIAQLFALIDEMKRYKNRGK